MTKEEIVEIIKAHRSSSYRESWTAFRAPWSVSSSEYLSFARRDLKEPDRRGCINAVGNAKRALECQLDSVMLSLHLEKRAQNVPAKLALATRVGVVAPGILRKINRHRNEVEHDYEASTPEVAGDFVDIVELFIAATRRHLDEHELDWSVEADPHFFYVARTTAGMEIRRSQLSREQPLATISYSDDQYLDLTWALCGGGDSE